MLHFLLRRFLYMLVIMWIAATVIFFALRVSPGNTATFVVSPSVTKHELDQVRKELGLDQPLYTQYLDFWRNLAQGDLGRSPVSDQRVTTIIAQGGPYTLLLAAAAALVAYGIGMPLGMLAALRRNGAADRVAAGVAVVGMGIPNFVLALILVMVVGVTFGLLPVSGSGGLSHLILPTVVLALEPMAVTIRVMRSSVLEQLNLDYVKALTAKGLSRRRVIWVHVFRNSLGPTIALTAVQLRTLLGYTLIVEVIFRWPGLGSQLVNAVSDRDYIVAQMLALALTFVVILVNFIADALYAYTDPRTRARVSEA
jgi:peptide/nickel transport system permease protein